MTDITTPETGGIQVPESLSDVSSMFTNMASQINKGLKLDNNSFAGTAIASVMSVLGLKVAAGIADTGINVVTGSEGPILGNLLPDMSTIAMLSAVAGAGIYAYENSESLINFADQSIEKAQPYFDRAIEATKQTYNNFNFGN